jgi:hypothetical protein
MSDDELLGPGLFWNMITQVFKGQWPSQSGAKTLSTARDQVKTIREYRNRVAHNAEPLWKAYQVNTPQDAIAYINAKIDTVEQLIQLLSPEKHDLLTKHRLFSNARRINSLPEIMRFRTTGNAQWLGSFGVTSAFQNAEQTTVLSSGSVPGRTFPYYPPLSSAGCYTFIMIRPEPFRVWDFRICGGKMKTG